MFSESQKRLVGLIRDEAVSCGARLFLVGGAVRDLLLQETLADCDLDFVTEQDAARCAHAVAQRLGAQFQEFPPFLTAKVSGIRGFEPITEVDFVSARREQYDRPGSLPCVARGAMSDDLRRRDFTINAMAVAIDDLLKALRSHRGPAQDFAAQLRTSLLDPFGGHGDLDGRILRVLHPLSFVDDPTRIFRGCRYAGRIAATFESETEKLLHTAIADGCLDTISRTRVLTEIKKICNERAPGSAVSLLERYGVWSALSLGSQGSGARLAAAVDRMALLSDAARKEAGYEAFVRVLFLALPESERRAQVVRYGFGRKLEGALNAIVLLGTAGANAILRAPLVNLIAAFFAAEGILPALQLDMVEDELERRGVLGQQRVSTAAEKGRQKQ